MFDVSCWNTIQIRFVRLSFNVLTWFLQCTGNQNHSIHWTIIFPVLTVALLSGLIQTCFNFYFKYYDSRKISFKFQSVSISHVFFRFTPDFPCLSLFVFSGVSPGLDIFRGCGGLRERRSVPSPGGVDQKLAWKEQQIGDLTMIFPCFLVNAIIYIQQFHHYPIIIHTFCGIWMTLRIFVWIILMIIVY